jgi:hypothetical protein
MQTCWYPWPKHLCNAWVLSQSTRHTSSCTESLEFCFNM